MAVNVIKRTWLQDRMVRPETLNGMAFQEEAGAHRFEITGYDSNGNEMAFSGTVTAIFLRPDNTDVSLTGVISNGVAQVTLSQECYQVPGRFGLAIFVNSGNTKTVVYKCIGPVGMTSSGVAASSVVQSVSTLIDRIDAAVNSIPQDYSALSKAVSATCPEMRDGSTGNPWNTNSITTKYIIKIDKSCDELILEYIGNTQAQYYVFGYSVFKGVADGTESYAARTSAASFLDYPEKYVQTEPYVIIPVSQLGDYTHIAIVLWAKSDETTFIPLRIATEQNNLRVTFRHASYMGHEEINNRSVKVGVQNASKMASPLKLVHFSDLHRDVNALNRIRASAKYVCPNADNIICTGDMVANTYAEITSWWIPEIMTCIGNHDTASYDGTYDWTALTMAQRDEMYISPFKAYWGIVHTAGTSYYYKDYTAAHIRLIVMDAMLYSGTPGAEATAQTQWLANLLASAITDSLHVIIAIHAPHGGSVPVACSFTKLGQENMPVNVDCNTPDVVINTVATAIGNGLHFIGYICGHTHQDAVWDCTGDRSQLMYCVTCAAVDQTAQWANSDQYRSEELDAFNVLTIDTASTTIKILRGGGANTDVSLRPRVSMVINYSTGKIITDTYASGTQDAVVYGEAQELTDAQKAQARANIGAGSAADVSENTADITANAEEITSLKSALDECFYNINDSASLWEQGTISVSGNESSSSISIRTDAYLAKSIVEIEPVTGWKFMLYAWNATTREFVGIYKNGTFITSVNWLTGSLRISGLQNYNLRVVARKTDESNITPADFAGMRLLVTVDNTLTKEFVPADAKETGNRIAENSSAISAFSDAVDDLDNATFVYAYSEKQVTDASISKMGFNASISGASTIGLGANANFDTYYWFAEKDTKLYADAANVAYLSICIGTNPTVDDFVWTSASAATLPCESAYRVRKSEGNLPTSDNPIILTKGDAVAITVTAGATCPVFLWEKTNVAKVDTIIANGVACDVQTSTVTITGDSYKVIFSKLTTTQGYQWNVTSLSGADGQNMFPAGVDIIGVIQFVGGSNFMGGVHGNESNYEFRVMADGADVSGAVVKDEIHIIMSSHLYDPDNTANNVVDRFVEFVFTTKGWTCRNTFEILVSTQIQVAYPSGLFAFTASDCDGAYSNVGTLNLASTSARQLESAEFKEITMNLPGKFTLNIHSETADKGWVTYRSNTTSFKVYFANAQEETVNAGTFISGKCEYRF